LLSRTGYTGELGFEIYCKNDSVKIIWDHIHKNFRKDGILPAGLGARDTLRLEMGYLLYGNDINIDINPIKAGLSWIVSLKKGDFIGKKEIISKKNKDDYQLVYFEMIEKSIPRPGFKILNGKDVVGIVTSGTISPSLNKGIGIAYIKNKYIKEGSYLSIRIRNKIKSAKIVKAPFYTLGTLNK